MSQIGESHEGYGQTGSYVVITATLTEGRGVSWNSDRDNISWQRQYNSNNIRNVASLNPSNQQANTTDMNDVNVTFY